ncbi:hypothetical protein SAMN05660649_04525 [Desulfotomaculum arcticum]|uniref:Uncharacterized protein n=1 Tax=Desulfotruncus arcticus DSM 17038 TaxID=1121424 RepID=A0A1I2YNR3_9FIRM|nr:hypothetical protein [Desulfotruncus arcticus]SFH27314.1 hypothetical protein SAMN05660649_04525 [Desulfotomaculum arcticum] [Desulfotruncus arcticus DSM 17038]
MAIAECKPLSNGKVCQLKSLVFLLMILGSILIVFYPHQLFKTLVSYIAIFAVLVSIPFAGRGTRIVCLGLLGVGAYLMFNSGASLDYWVEAMGKNVSLLVLLITVPLLGMPLEIGEYIEVLDSLTAKYMKRRWQMYWVPAICSHIFGVFMNIGAVPLTYKITARGAVLNCFSILTKSISRGVGTIFFWSPNTVAVALVLDYLNVPWPQFFCFGILFASIALVLGYISDFMIKKETKNEKLVEIQYCYYNIDKFKVIQLAAYGVIFLSAIIMIEIASSFSVINMVPIIALIYPALWLLLMRRKESLVGGYLDYFKNHANKYDSEVILFTSAGFFSSALSISGWSEKLCHLIMHFAGKSVVSVSLTILVTIVLTSIAGIHPMISVSTFAALDTSTIGIDPVIFALILAGGWSLGSTISPISGNCLVVANIMGKTPLEVSYMNWFYSFWVMVALLLFVTWIS